MSGKIQIEIASDREFPTRASRAALPIPRGLRGSARYRRRRVLSKIAQKHGVSGWPGRANATAVAQAEDGAP